MCRNLARVAGGKMVMLTKSDDRKYGYLRRYTACIFIGVGSLSISIGRVRPEAVVLNNASLHLRYLKVKCFDYKFTIFLNNMYERKVFVRVAVVW